MAFAVNFKGGGLSLKLLLTSLSILLLITPGEAFFRHLCFFPVGNARVDPIMSPGDVSQHVHALFGSGNLGPDATNADILLEANCTSCSITVDKSGYWAPAMYFQHANGTFESVTTAGGTTIYYKTERRVNFETQNYTAFPQGFRMIAGDAEKRGWVGPWPVPEQSFWGPADTTQDALATKALGMNCLNYPTGPNEATFQFPFLRNKAFTDAQCVDGIRAEVMFPSCWDGINLDSSDHKSHVAYPTLLQDGACPLTHPVYLPILFYETIWNTQAFSGVPGQYVFSNGDPTGYGYHGDFFAAWEEGVLDQIMQDPTCTDHNLQDRHSQGVTELCPVLAPHIQSQVNASQCQMEMPEVLQDEQVIGLMASLPGGVKVTGELHWPGTGVDDKIPGFNGVPFSSVIPEPLINPTVVAPAVSSSIALPTSQGNTSLISSTTLAAIPATNITSAYLQSTSTLPIISSSTYTTDGKVVEVDIIEQIVTVTATVVPETTAAVVRRHMHGVRHHNGV